MLRAMIPAMLFVSVLVLPARAFSAVGLGASLGLTIHDPSESGIDNVVMIGVPTQTSVFSSVRPGLRVAFTGEAMDHEAFLDLGFDRLSSGDDSFRATRVGANYQYNFPGSSVRPFVTAGAGIYSLHVFDGPGGSATSMTFGGGAGIGMPVSGGAGRLRFEARYDHLEEGQSNTEVVIGEASIIQVMLGFDLWIR